MVGAPDTCLDCTDASLAALAQEAGRALLAAGWRLATAESCTGGWISKCLTDIAGSSSWFERGYVTYSDVAKVQALGVPPLTLRAHGAVSAETALEMAAGARRWSDADVAVSVTGIAGPDGGSTDKPVGLVWFGLARREGATMTEERRFSGDRAAIRRAAVAAALRLVVEAAGNARRDPTATTQRK